MPLSRKHPCLGWLSCTPTDSQYLLDRQIQFRDQALANDPHYESGMPPAFVDWTMRTWLPSVAGNAFYRAQIEQQIIALQLASDDLQDSIYRQVGSQLEKQSTIDAQRHQLIELLESSQ